MKKNVDLCKKNNKNVENLKKCGWYFGGLYPSSRIITLRFFFKKKAVNILICYEKKILTYNDNKFPFRVAKRRSRITL